MLEQILEGSLAIFGDVRLDVGEVGDPHRLGLLHQQPNLDHAFEDGGEVLRSRLGTRAHRLVGAGEGAGDVLHRDGLVADLGGRHRGRLRTEERDLGGLSVLPGDLRVRFLESLGFLGAG